MFNLIKSVLGFASCSGCLHTRLGGLYCACSRPERLFLHRAWSRLGCMFYSNRYWYDNHGNRHLSKAAEES